MALCTITRKTEARKHLQLHSETSAEEYTYDSKFIIEFFKVEKEAAN